MSIIGKLPGFNSLTVPQEQQTELTAQQPATQPARSTGIANTNDGFETGNPRTANLFGLSGEQTEILLSNQMMISPDSTVNASMLFDYVTDVQRQAPEPTDPMSRKEFRPDRMEQVHHDVEEDEPARRAAKERDKEMAMADSELSKRLFHDEDRKNDLDLGLGDDITDPIFDGMREVGLGDVADWLRDTGNDAIGIVGGTVNWAGGAVADAAKATGQAVGDAGEWTIEAAEDIAEAAAKAAEEAAKAAAKAAEDAAAAAAEAAEDAINEVGEVLEDVGEAVGDVASDVGDFIGDLW